MRRLFLAIGLCLLVCCRHSSGRGDAGETLLPAIPVTLPDGAVIRAELAATPADQQRGLMHRTRLASDRGMLFVFPEAVRRPFWMYSTLIPLDIIWMDTNHSIVFISANTPPCPPEKGTNCPNYGGSQPARYVLELAAGAGAGHGLKVGDRLRF